MSVKLRTRPGSAWASSIAVRPPIEWTRQVEAADAGLVEHFLYFKDALFGRLQYRVEPAQDRHGENDVRIFAAFEKVAQDIVSDAPDERNDFIVGGLVHFETGRGGQRGGQACTRTRPRLSIEQTRKGSTLRRNLVKTTPANLIFVLAAPAL